ncbi:MAG: metallophosphoesterase [Beijerinckiaceae bacterium]
MPLLTRRRFMQAGAGAMLGATGFGSWAFAIEPGFMLDVTTYNVAPPNWPADLRLKAVVLADIHACEPWMSAQRIRHICDVANALEPDIVFLLGDYQSGMRMVTAPVWPEQWGAALSALKAPLGVYGVLGNHDIWHGVLPGVKGDKGATVARTLRHASVRVLDNDVARVTKNGAPFWIAGLADQMDEWDRTQRRWVGLDDLDGTLRRVTDDAPVILLAHEPFIFPRVPKRVAMTLCGHTHGGQVMLPLIGNPLLLRRIKAAYAYGHVIEDGRHMIVSAGLGTSIMPARFMRPPEIVQINFGSGEIA